MKCQIRKNAARCKLNGTFLRMTTFLDKQMLFNFCKVVIQLKKNAFNSLKAVIQFNKSCHLIQKHGYKSLKVVIQFKNIRSIH